MINVQEITSSAKVTALLAQSTQSSTQIHKNVTATLDTSLMSSEFVPGSVELMKNSTPKLTAANV